MFLFFALFLVVSVACFTCFVQRGMLRIVIRKLRGYTCVQPGYSEWKYRNDFSSTTLRETLGLERVSTKPVHILTPQTCVWY